ncbi:GntR family transcriptional regulator [Roseibium sp.]|uniref:GntR family transcriptional regulator n=1 Tax=Roseibium sp. TaxID=1936156 RepID=UPI003B5255C5
MKRSTRGDMTDEGLEAKGEVRRKRAPNAPPTSQIRYPAGGAKTLAQVQYQRMLDRITTMELLPGAPISEPELAAEAGVSRTPVREAIQRLAREGLVEVVPKSGTFVARIPVSALPEAVLARRALEGMTARAAAKLATRSQVLSLRVILEEHKELAATGDRELFHKSDERFHEQLAGVGQLPGLWRLVQQVKLQLDRFRRLTLPEEGRLKLIIDEHTAVVDAIEAGDSDLAVKAIETHLSGLQLHIETVVAAHPDYFIYDCDPSELLKI